MPPPLPPLHAALSLQYLNHGLLSGRGHILPLAWHVGLGSWHRISTQQIRVPSWTCAVVFRDVV